MALQRSLATSNLLGGVPKKTQEVGLEKRMTTRNLHQRPAFGDISNKTTVLAGAKAGISNQGQKGKVVGEKAAVKKKTVAAATKQPSAPARGMGKPLIVAVPKQVEPAKQETIPEEEEVQTIAPEEEACLENASTSSCAMDVSENSDATTTGEVAFSNQMYGLMLRDIDEEDAENPQLVSEYAKDIYRYMMLLEIEMPIREDHLRGQPEINGRMRAILVDWLVQVHQKFHMLQETLFLAIAILDRYLQLEFVTKAKLQLVGVSAMWIAAKYEEMYAPEVSDFSYITDNAYTKAEIRQMECAILRALDFSLGRPLPIHFLRRFSKASDVDAHVHNLAKYFMELALVPCEMAHLKPSFLAAAALRLSQKLLGDYAWGSLMTFYTGHEETNLSPLMAKLARLVLNAGTGKTTAVKAKYQSSKLMKVSLLEELSSVALAEISAWPTTPLFAE